MFVLMNSLQQQFQEQKELFNSMKQNTDKETAKTRLKFDQNSKNNIIFDESKREITILKPTTIKFEAATNESVLDNYYQQDQQPHGYKTTMVCPRTPPPSNNFIHHDRYKKISALYELLQIRIIEQIHGSSVNTEKEAKNTDSAR